MSEINKEQLSRINIIAQMYRRGTSVHDIRGEVQKRLALENYSISTCRNDIKVMLEEWKETRTKRLDETIELELARIDEVIKEAWGAWERSKENSKRTTQRQRALPSVEGENIASEDVAIVSMEQEQTEETQVGDPRFLEIINRMGAERRKMLGLYQPEKLELTGADGSPVKVEHRFNGFSFIPYTEGLSNSDTTRIASGEVIEELTEQSEEKEPIYAEIVDERTTDKHQAEGSIQLPS